MALLTRRYARTRPHTAPTQEDAPLYAVASEIMAAFATRDAKTAWLFAAAWLVTLVICLWLVGLLVAANTRPGVAVYVVEVEVGTGVVRTVTPPDIPYKPELAAIRDQIERFIKATYGLSTDGKIVGDAWTWAYGVVTQQGGERLNVLGQQRDPRRWAGKKAIAIDIKRVLHPSDVTVDMTWSEVVTTQETGAREVFTLANGVKTTERIWSGQFTVIVRPPKTTQELHANPLGIWVDNWSISGM
jgi:type IV secretory pathway TrbF-like protein